MFGLGLFFKAVALCVALQLLPPWLSGEPTRSTGLLCVRVLVAVPQPLRVFSLTLGEVEDEPEDSLSGNPSLSLPTDYAISKPGVLSQIEQGEESRVRNEQDLEESEIITDATAGEGSVTRV